MIQLFVPYKMRRVWENHAYTYGKTLHMDCFRWLEANVVRWRIQMAVGGAYIIFQEEYHAMLFKLTWWDM